MPPTPSLDVTAVIAAPSGLVLKAFFDPAALGAWWQVARSVTTRARPTCSRPWYRPKHRDPATARVNTSSGRPGDQ